MSDSPTPEVAEPVKVQATPEMLMSYAGVADELAATDDDFSAAKAAFDAISAVRASITAKASAFVEATGTDPLSIFPEAPKSKRGAPKGPRDPQRRMRVVKAIGDNTVADIMRLTSEDRNYVNSVLSTEQDKGRAVKVGTSGSFRYQVAVPAAA